MSKISDPPAEAAPIRVRAGIAQLGTQVVVHGKDLHHECMDLSFVHYYLFCVTGRAFTPAQARVLEEIWIATGYPDARIWCNRIAGYLGAARVDPALAMSAALAASNSTAYGFRALRSAYAVQAAIPEASDAREAWLRDALADKRTLHGYGRPIHGHDERIAVALRTLRDARMAAGPALRRAFWLDRRLRARKGIEINVAAVMASVCLDFGLDAREFESFMVLMFTPGYIAVYADQRARPPFSFLAGHQSRAAR